MTGHEGFHSPVELAIHGPEELSRGGRLIPPVYLPVTEM